MALRRLAMVAITCWRVGGSKGVLCCVPLCHRSTTMAMVVYYIWDLCSRCSSLSPSLSVFLPYLSSDMSHHFKVSQCLKDLPDEDLITLGCALGLSFPKLKRMRTLPSDMVAAWLRKEDNVLEHGKPTMSLLATALKRIGQNGIANSILQNVQA